LPGADDFVARELRNLLREQALLDGARFTDLPVLFMVRAVFASSAQGRFAAIAAEGDLLLQDFEELGVGPRLFDEIADTALHGFDGDADRGPAGHHDDGRDVRERPEMGEQIETFAAGSGVARVVQVHEQQIEFAKGDDFEKLGRGADSLGGVAVAFEQERESTLHVGLVVGDQDARLHAFTFRFTGVGQRRWRHDLRPRT